MEDMSSNLLDLEDKQVFVYPNPVKDNLHIELNEINRSEVLLEVYDLFGRKVDRYKIKKEGLTTLNVSDFLPGIYFGVIQVENKEMLFKFLKE